MAAEYVEKIWNQHKNREFYWPDLINEYVADPKHYQLKKDVFQGQPKQFAALFDTLKKNRFRLKISLQPLDQQD